MMIFRVNCILLLFFLIFAFNVNAQQLGNVSLANTSTNQGFRTACIGSIAQTDVNINNVRARLRAGGDIWWDGNESHYVVPNLILLQASLKFLLCLLEQFGWEPLMMAVILF